MRRILFISTLLLFICVSSFGMAFNNHRSGFIIGGLGGFCVDNWSMVDEDGVKIDSGTANGLHFDFRIGVGFKGDKLMLYCWGLVNYFGGGSYSPAFNMMYGIGVSYYFKPIAPSFYVNAGFGIQQYSYHTRPNWIWFGYHTEEYLGPGIMGGIGYEFARHWSMEFGVMWSYPRYQYDDDDIFDEYKADKAINSLAITLSIIRIAY